MDCCLACLGLNKNTDDDDNAPLLQEHDPLPPQSKSDKFVDVLVALNAGKLPSQDQLNGFLRYILKSELLHDDVHAKVVSGKGPTSKLGRRVIRDAREVVQSVLQLGMEKNDDNKLQNVIYQLSQIEGVPINVDINVPAEAGPAINAAEAGASKLSEEVPSKGELASDTEILLSCIKTLLHTTLTSSIFRLLVSDTLDLSRQLVVHAAVDVESAAQVVQEVAEDVEKKARSENVDEVGLQGMKDKSKEVVEGVIGAGQKIRREWEGTADDMEREGKRKIVERIKDMLVRAQRDPASRHSLHAILLLVRKYSDIASKMSTTLAETAAEAAEASTSANTYPPCPYPSNDPIIDIDITSSSLEEALTDMKILIERLAHGKSINPLWRAFTRVVQDLSEFPADIVEAVEEKTEEKIEEVQEAVKEKEESTAKILKARPPGKKGKKKGKSKTPQAKSPVPANPLEPSAWDDNVLGSEIVQPQAHNGPTQQQQKENGKQLSEKDFPPLPSQQEPPFPEQKKKPNPYRVYFHDLGTYLDRALSQPGWAASDEGTEVLENLVSMSSDLLSVAGEAVGEALAEATTQDEKKQDTLKARFGRDLQALFREIDQFAVGVESDRATMQFLRAFERLGVDFTSLLSAAPKEGKKKAHSAARGVFGFGFGSTWTQWLSWGIPKIIQMIPPNWIPIPTMEVKTPTVDGALDALWLRESASWSGDANTGIKGDLVPDHITFRDWTEVVVDMSSSDPDAPDERVIRSSSRIRLHMEGISASVRGMGYYFRYKGAILDYEDEGILSVNLGTRSRRGAGLDIELEVDSSTEAFENVWYSDRIVEGEDDMSPNIDVQRTVASSSAGRVPVSQTSLGPALQEPVEPLFRVVDVHLNLDGMSFHLDKSKHWIMNKLLMQPIGVPALAHIMRTAIEENIRRCLGWFAVGVGRLLAETKERRRRKRDAKRDSIKYREPIWDLDKVEEEIEDESAGELIADWWCVIVEKGPEAFGYDVHVDASEDEDVETFTNVEATSKGLIYTSTTMQAEPALIVNPIVSPEEMETFDLTQEGYNFRRPSPEELGSVQQVEETVVAVGAGPQLFPGKIGPQGNGDELQVPPVAERVAGAVKAGAEGIKKGVGIAKGRIQEGVDELQRARERKGKRKQVELSRDGWRSPVFDMEWVSIVR